MEKLLWLDGHISLIDGEEALLNAYEEMTDNGHIWVLFYGDFEFEWHNNMWMQR